MSQEPAVGGDTTGQLPPEKPGRIVGFDLARCLAIFGMVYVNFEVIIAPAVPKPELLRTIATAFEGNASALFVTLAGIGIVLLDQRRLLDQRGLRQREGRPRATLLKRSLFLLVVGYSWQAYWDGDILHYYAFYLAIGVAFLRLKAWWLWLAAASSIGIWVLLFREFNYGAGWQWLTLSYQDFWTLEGQLRNLFFNGWHPLFPWLAFLFVGMALAKISIHQPRVRRIALGGSAAVYAGAYFLSESLVQIPDERHWTVQLARWFEAPEAFWALASIPPGPLYVTSAAAAATFLIAACLELTANARVARLLTPLVRTGQLALSIYLLHVVFLNLAVKPFQDDHADQRLELAAVATLIFCVASVLFATIWKSRFRIGPLEWVMRTVTFEKRRSS